MPKSRHITVPAGSVTRLRSKILGVLHLATDALERINDLAKQRLDAATRPRLRAKALGRSRADDIYCLGILLKK